MIGFAGQQLGGPILAQMVLSYPTGRLRTRFERFTVDAIWAAAIGVSAVIALAFDPRADGCTRCAWEPVAFPSRHAVLTAQLGFRTGFPRYVAVSAWRTPQEAGPVSLPKSPAMSEPAAAIRVVLADDSVLFREGLARVLADNGFVVAGQAGDAGELHAMVARKPPMWR